MNELKKFRVVRGGEGIKFMFGKGWSLINILIGLVFIASALVVSDFINFLSFIGFFPMRNSLPSWYYFYPWIVLSMITLGVLGFWFVIPAFQKWWHTKRWLAWTFLGIGSVLIYPFIFLIYPVIYLFRF
jgi:hypothetical protein